MGVIRWSWHEQCLRYIVDLILCAVTMNFNAEINFIAGNPETQGLGIW